MCTNNTHGTPINNFNKLFDDSALRSTKEALMRVQAPYWVGKVNTRDTTELVEFWVSSPLPITKGEAMEIANALKKAVWLKGPKMTQVEAWCIINAVGLIMEEMHSC